MGMHKGYKVLFAAGVLFLVCKITYAWWNPNELVTLHGKNIPVTDALKSFSSQTHRKIFYPATLDQKVSVDFEKVPLEEALEAVAGQAELSNIRVFLLTSDSTRKNDLLGKLSEQTEQPVLMRLARTARWGDFGNRPDGTISYTNSTQNVDALIADLNLKNTSYFYYSGEFSGPLSVSWSDVPIRTAADKLASMTKTDTTRLYQVFARNRQGNNRRDWSPDDMAKMAQKTSDEIATLPPAEKAAAEEQWKAQQERMKEFASMTDDQRMTRVMQRFTSGNMEERLIRNLKNSTPEQRAKRYQRFEARRQASGNGTPPPATPKPTSPQNP